MTEPLFHPASDDALAPVSSGDRRPWVAPVVTFEETLEAIAGVCDVNQGGKGNGLCTFGSS